jgi:hypothetical protein
MDSTVSDLGFKMLFTIDSTYDWPDPHRESDILLRSRLHPKCGHFKTPPPRTIVTSWFSETSVLCGTHFNTVVIRRDLYDFLNIASISGLEVGELRSDTGEAFSDHVSIWTPEQVVLRGGSGSSGTPCEHCGMHRYFPRGVEMYVTRASMEGRDVALADGPAMLVVSQRVADELASERASRGWSLVTSEMLIEKEHAVDGLPDDYVRPQEYIGVSAHLF